MNYFASHSQLRPFIPSAFLPSYFPIKTTHAFLLSFVPHDPPISSPLIRSTNNNQPVDYASAIQNYKHDSRKWLMSTPNVAWYQHQHFRHTATCRTWFLSQDVREQVTPHTAAVPTLRSTNYFLELLEEQLPLPGATNYQCSFVDTQEVGAIPQNPRQDRVTLDRALLGNKDAGPESMAK
jgi:hypothetical protein